MPESAAHLIWLLVAIGGLWGATAVTLRGAIRLSGQAGIYDALIGTLVLGVGTNLPELGVAWAGAGAALGGIDASGLVVGTATGSALAQVALVLGLAGLIGPVVHAEGAARRWGLPLLAAVLVFGLVAADGEISRLDGLLLVLAFLTHLGVVVVRGGSLPIHTADPVPHGLLPASVLLVAGLGATLVFSHFAVSRGVALAAAWGAEQTLVGLLILGIGSSVPELVLSLGAALRGRATLALGTAFGNAIFDLLLPAGTASLLHPLAVRPETIRYDLPAIVFATLLVMTLHRRSDGTGPTPRDRRRAAGLVAFFGVYALFRMVVG